MTVLTMIRVGFSSDVLAILSALSMSLTLLPSLTSKTSQPLAINLALTDSEKDKSILPSNVTLFES